MNRYVIDEFYQDPNLRRRLFLKARNEQVREIKQFFAWLRQKLTLKLHGRDWLARLG